MSCDDIMHKMGLHLVDSLKSDWSIIFIGKSLKYLTWKITSRYSYLSLVLRSNSVDQNKHIKQNLNICIILYEVIILTRLPKKNFFLENWHQWISIIVISYCRNLNWNNSITNEMKTRRKNRKKGCKTQKINECTCGNSTSSQNIEVHTLAS